MRRSEDVEEGDGHAFGPTLLLKCFVPVIYSLGGRLLLAISSKAKSRDMHAD
jgi:hypothetical protein